MASCSQKEKLTSFRYSYVLARVKKEKMMAERLDIQIGQTRIQIIITLITTM